MSEQEDAEVVRKVRLPNDLRERFDAIKEECKEANPHLPEPSDVLMINGLLDTWGGAEEGLCGGNKDPSRKYNYDYVCRNCGYEHNYSGGNCPRCKSKLQQELTND